MIQLNNITFSYDNNPVLKHVSLDIPKGQIMCVIGPNGCGKTTLLNCILGLNTLEAGEISINNQNIISMDEKKRAKIMSFVPQDKGDMFPFKVIDIVLMGRTPYIGAFSSPGKLDMEIAVDALRQVGIEGFSNRIFTRLSGGERQLVILARTIAQQTPIIIMDEPTAFLDYRNELVFLETIIDMVRKKALTVVMATHFPNHALYFENRNMHTRITMLSECGIMAVGRPNEVLQENNIKDLYGIEAAILSYNENKKYIVPIKTLRR